jgi:lysozyme family protein
MADFTIALNELLSYEGGYSNNAADAGGETVYGIARKWQPNWPGWVLVDSLKTQRPNLVDLNAALKADSQVQLAVQQFYRQKFWNFDKVPSQLVANKMFEMEINFGPGSAVRILQQGLVRLGHAIALDGSLGPATLALLQTQNEPDTLHALRTYSVLYRMHRVLAQPDQIQFLEGWVWRDCS